ncbi:hypothetical protein ABZ957_30415 [Streptomyces sp. NPDC046316]|uniref:hypothetical protein n=1 Tax=Streptomyces sp. NPDC046316 TaxID=3154494 RepID=UPI0033D98407
MTSFFDSFDRQPDVSREEREDPIPTPWSSFTPIAELVYRRKVGVVAEQGTAEASLGKDVAVHAANLGIPTLLYTPHPPSEVPRLLMVDPIAHPTTDRINVALDRQHRGRTLEFVVIERYERLRPRESYIPDQYDPIDDLDYEPPTEGDELLRAVQEIRNNVPLLLTTLTTNTDPSRRLIQVLDLHHPAVVLTDACKPVITLHRTSPQTVQARIELGPYPGDQLVTLGWPTAVLADTNDIPPMRTLAEIRHALSTHGAPGDRARFDAEIDAIDLDDHTRVREITQAYRQRIELRNDTEAASAAPREETEIDAEVLRQLYRAAGRTGLSTAADTSGEPTVTTDAPDPGRTLGLGEASDG